MNVGAASTAERGELLPSRGSFSGGGGSSAALATPGSRSAGSRGHSCLLQVCRVFNFLTGLCALLCALAFGMAIVVRGEAASKVRLRGGGGQAWVCVVHAGSVQSRVGAAAAAAVNRMYCCHHRCCCCCCWATQTAGHPFLCCRCRMRIL